MTDANSVSRVPAQVKPDPSLDQHATEIRAIGRRTVADIVEIGRLLTLCKENLAQSGHGHWLAWLDQEFGWTEQTALNFMRINELNKSKKFLDLDLPVSALYLLAAPSTPEEVRTEVIERAEKGEHLSVQVVKTTIAKARPHRAANAKPAGKKSKSPAPKAALSTLAWSDATLEQRQHFLDGAGLQSIREAMPPAWRADSVARVPLIEPPSSPPAAPGSEKPRRVKKSKGRKSAPRGADGNGARAVAAPEPGEPEDEPDVASARAKYADAMGIYSDHERFDEIEILFERLDLSICEFIPYIGERNKKRRAAQRQRDADERA